MLAYNTHVKGKSLEQLIRESGGKGVYGEATLGVLRAVGWGVVGEGAKQGEVVVAKQGEASGFLKGGLRWWSMVFGVLAGVVSVV